MINADDLDFLQNVIYYLSSGSSYLPPGVSDPEAFIQKTRCYFIKNKTLFFGNTPNSGGLRVLNDLSERQSALASVAHLRDGAMSRYHTLGKEFYWPNFDQNLGVFAEEPRAQTQSVRILHVCLNNSSVYLNVEEASGFLQGSSDEHGHFSLADFIFGSFCRTGSWPLRFTLVNCDDVQLHSLKVELAHLLKEIESMKESLSHFSSFVTSHSMTEQDASLIDSLKDFIQSHDKNWRQALPGWIYSHNAGRTTFAPTRVHPPQKRSSAEGHPTSIPQKKSSSNDEHTESVVSTVRSLLSVTKSERSRRGKYYKYDPEIRDSIAEFALQHGVSEASKHFTEELELKISSSTIRNFIKSYQAYTPELKEEIGKYASERGSEECFEHFKSRFQPSEEEAASAFTLSLVSRFKKYYESKATGSKNEDGSTRMFVVDIPVSPPIAEGTVPPKNFFNSKLKNDIGQYAFHWGNKKTVEHFSVRLQFPVKESTVRKFKKRWMQANNIPFEEESNSPSPVNKGKEAKKGRKIVKETIGEEINDDEEEEESGLDEGSKARLYSSYNPELRAEIAKYALVHSNKETAAHFLSLHNKVLPRSTIRFLRDKYKAMNSKDGSSQLDFGPRGRPTRLGCYDSVLQKCIIDLARSGEKLTSFLVIATAKQVLLKHDPSLLKENGGSISLDPNWAKSILRRVQRSLKKSS